MLTTLQTASVFCAFVVTTGLLYGLLKSGWVGKIMDRPNSRSLHYAPTPRIGGLAILAGILAGWVVVGDMRLAPIYLITFALALVSFLDDLKSLPVWQRFLAHLLAAVMGVFFLASGQVFWVSTFAVLAIVWMTNLFNFMDGSDGLAGGMALLGFAVFAWQAASVGDVAVAGFSIIVAAAALGFLLFNFHPARVFMGDAGSIPLGFLAGLLGFLGWINGLWPVWFPVLVFSPFVVDATLTLFKRLLRGDRVWQAHREHYYQRLILLGHGHRKIAWLEYALMLVAGGSALWGARQSIMLQVTMLGVWVFAYMVLAWMIDKRWREAGNKIK